LVRRVLDEGALFLPKPFDQHTLLEKVQAALDDA
jgi:FixJ family two-component response regulator